MPRPQFRLRSLFIVTTAVAVGFAVIRLFPPGTMDLSLVCIALFMVWGMLFVAWGLFFGTLMYIVERVKRRRAQKDATPAASPPNNPSFQFNLRQLFVAT